MKYYKLNRLTYQLWDTTVQSKNGSRYIVQIWYGGPKPGYQAHIQKVGEPENRPLMEMNIPNLNSALASINLVMRKIGIQLELGE